MKKILFIILSAALLTGITLFTQGCGKNKNEGTLPVSGNVEVTEIDLGFKMPGRISELTVDEGSRVKKGDKLATLESLELGSEVAKAQAGVFEAEARLKELKAGSRPQEIKGSEADLSYADAELEKAKKDLERADILYKNGAISASQFDSYKRAHDTTLARKKAVSEKLNLVKEGPRKEEIKAAEYRLKQVEAVLAAVSERYKDAVLYSPVDGVVLKRNSEAGETVGAGMPVFTIGDLENPWIKVYVKEDKLGRVKLGQTAEVKTDSYPDKAYQGKVTYISSEAEFTPKNVQTQEERVKLVFGVKVGVKNVNDELKPGMPADVKIILQ